MSRKEAAEIWACIMAAVAVIRAQADAAERLGQTFREIDRMAYLDLEGIAANLRAQAEALEKLTGE
jgi:hypothetical protein